MPRVHLVASSLSLAAMPVPRIRGAMRRVRLGKLHGDMTPKLTHFAINTDDVEGTQAFYGSYDSSAG